MKNHSYLIILENKKRRKISVGRLGKILFDSGYYLYAGSGGKNVLSRILRHIRKKKRRFWHIDNLTTNFLFRGFIIFPKTIKECTIAQKLEKSFGLAFVNRFGTSDCRCASHLFLL